MRRCSRACALPTRRRRFERRPAPITGSCSISSSRANQNGYGDLIQIGDGSSAQNTIDKVPHDFVLSHLYVHGDPLVGQKRCVSLNAATVTIRDSHISDCKGVGNDTQAICGWNGPGPYLIENNYLEGAGENVMFGGADPAIPNLVADGITFRHNLVSRPMSWRDPIISAPKNPSGTSMAGGALAPGSYAYRIVARRGVGQGTIGRSTPSVEVTVSVSAPASAVRLTWQPVAEATEYQVYGRTAGAQGAFWTVNGTEFTDTGSAGTAGAVPTSPGTVWTVKNLFELKNARTVVVEDNIFENHWKDAQPGYAIVLDASQLERRLRLVRGRARALRVQPGAKRCRRHQPARLRQRQSVPAGGRHRVP